MFFTVAQISKSLLAYFLFISSMWSFVVVPGLYNDLKDPFLKMPLPYGPSWRVEESQKIFPC